MLKTKGSRASCSRSQEGSPSKLVTCLQAAKPSTFGGFLTGSSIIHGLGWIVYTTAYLLPVMCSQPHLLLGFTMLSSTLRKDVFRNCTSCFKASFRHSRDKRQIIRFYCCRKPFNGRALLPHSRSCTHCLSISDLSYYCGRGVGQVDHLNLIHIRWITLVKNCINP